MVIYDACSPRLTARLTGKSESPVSSDAVVAQPKHGESVVVGEDIAEDDGSLVAQIVLFQVDLPETRALPDQLHTMREPSHSLLFSEWVSPP